ncbi:hypothetical protein [Psychroserpens sp. MEBiC05023]
MKTIFTTLCFVTFINLSSSQDIIATYVYEKELEGRNSIKEYTTWYFSRLDSLVLYKDGTFYRNVKMKFNETIQTQYNGKWRKENRILTLYNLKINNEEKLDDRKEFRFKIKRKKIIPLSANRKDSNKMSRLL